MYSDLVGLIDRQTSGDLQLGDALAREEAEQEELCDILSRFYDVIRPEEEEVRIQVFLKTNNSIEMFNVYLLML